MNKELQEYYEQQLLMFLHPGWKHFASHIQGMVDATDTLAGVTKDTVEHKQGELAIMRWVLDWPEALKKAYEQLEEEPDADI